MSSLNPIAATGFTAADSYDAHRPSYHPVAVSFLLSRLGLPAESPRLVELACGTGKFTELLAPVVAGRIIAVEPHDSMADVLRRKDLPVEVRKGSAVDIPVEDGWADAVVAAQVGYPPPFPSSFQKKNKNWLTGGNSPRLSTGSPPQRLSPRSRASSTRPAQRRWV